MNSTPITFSQKWNVMLSPEKELAHRSNALYNHIVTIATAVAFVALAVISSLFFPELATFLIIATAFLLTPGVEFARSFLNKARESKKLENQAVQVRAAYDKLILAKATNPEIKALSFHWNNKALQAQKTYNTLYQKALEKANDAESSSSLITKYRLEALDAENKSMKIKVYSLFLESLIGNQKTFEKVFLKHGENFSSTFSTFSKWDSRETEKRAMDPKFTNNDFLLTFYNKNISPISYDEVYQEKLKENLKSRLYQALTEQLV